MQDIYAGYPVKTYGKITTRPYQQYAIDKAIEHCRESREPAIMDISVGGGKSLIVAAIADHVTKKNGKALVISRQGIIISQNSDEAWGMRIENSTYSASLGGKSTVYPLIMTTEGTFANALKKDIEYDLSLNRPSDGSFYEPSEFYGMVFDLVLLDEAHHLDVLDDEEKSQYRFIMKQLLKRNPKTRIIGLTGSPFRGVVPIIGEDLFWKKKIVDISQDYMIDMNYLVPVQFGFPDVDKYDLSEFQPVSEDGTQDFTAQQMKDMEKKIMSNLTMTERIVHDVVEKTKDRNCVIFTVASKRHGKEVAKCLPKGTYAIISDDMSEKSRDRALKKAYDGEIKYLIQQNVLVTGYNNPLADTIVILRKIGSLTLLVQLIGRALRLLKPEQIERGIIKKDGLILDYTDTMDHFREAYDSRVLDDYDREKSKKDNDTITCPKCGTENGSKAKRCCNVIDGVRCDFFWHSKICEPHYRNGRLVNSGCGAENSPSARECRLCKNILSDWNEKLKGTHYKQTDYKPVEKFDMKPTKNDGVLVEYYLPNNEVAKAFYSPFSGNETAKRIFYNKFVKFHATTPSMKKVCRFARNAGELCNHKKELDTIGAITHRLDVKGKSIITKMLTKEEMKKL